MKKLITLTAVFTFMFLLVGATNVKADELDDFVNRMNTELAKSECGDIDPKAVINVMHGVTGDIDSGLGGYWAYDRYSRSLVVYRRTDGNYCALVRYAGSFDAQEGKTSPGNGYVLDGNEDGNFKGGYRAKIRGTLKENPDYPTMGYIGDFDYGCDIENPSSCNYWSWLGAYFEPDPLFQYQWWGWFYRAYGHGWWLNAITGNSGDIN